MVSGAMIQLFNHLDVRLRLQPLCKIYASCHIYHEAGIGHSEAEKKSCLINQKIPC